MSAAALTAADAADLAEEAELAATGGLGGSGAATGWRSSFGAWAPLELAALQELVLLRADDGVPSWGKIAKALGTGRSKGACSFAWKKSLCMLSLALRPAAAAFQPSAIGSEALAGCHGGGAGGGASRDEWPEAELQALGVLVIRHGVGDWGKKATLLDSGRAQSSVAAAWQRHGDRITAANPAIGQLEAIVCKVCNDGKHDSQMVLCDGCPDAYHTFCLKPALDAIPEGDWFCPVCKPSPQPDPQPEQEAPGPKPKPKVRAKAQPKQKRKRATNSGGGGSSGESDDDEGTTDYCTTPANLKFKKRARVFEPVIAGPSRPRAAASDPSAPSRQFLPDVGNDRSEKARKSGAGADAPIVFLGLRYKQPRNGQPETEPDDKTAAEVTATAFEDVSSSADAAGTDGDSSSSGGTGMDPDVAAPMHIAARRRVVMGAGAAGSGGGDDAQSESDDSGSESWRDDDGGSNSAHLEHTQVPPDSPTEAAAADVFRSHSKKPFNDDEDALVVELVHEHGAKNWPLIASHLPGRVGKQCRERWANVLRSSAAPLRSVQPPRCAAYSPFLVGNSSRRWLNHLNPSVRKGPWTIAEEETLVHGHRCGLAPATPRRWCPAAVPTADVVPPVVAAVPELLVLSWVQ